MSIEKEPVPVGYIYKQKDCYGLIQTVFKVDKPYITWHNVTDVTPVYTAPPKREPSMTGREMYQRGYAAAERELIARYKPVSDAELIARYETIKVSLFYAGFRDAEKAHGITGGEE
jgi:hypothetical protein